MIKVKPIVKDLLLLDEHAKACLEANTLNLSEYARSIRPKVEQLAKKTVQTTTISMALSRIRRELPPTKPLTNKVVIGGITVKSPLTQLVYEKTSQTLRDFSQIMASYTPNTDELLLSTQNTKSLIIICGQTTRSMFESKISTPPIKTLDELAAIGLNLDPAYQEQPNIVYSLLSQLAPLRIPLIDVISSWSEVIVIVRRKHVGSITETLY